MKIVKIIGGLGNQMFQYAFAIALKQHFPCEDILFDCTYMEHYGLHNGLELNRIFGVDLPQASTRQLLMVTRPVKHHKLSRMVRRILPDRSTECVEKPSNEYISKVFDDRYCYYEGYWQNPLYFDDCRETILRAFRFDESSLSSKSRDLLGRLESCDSVSIHIRRGDYLKSKVYRGCAALEYYRQAVDYVLARIAQPTFYVFSDDIEWCRQNMQGLLGTHATHYVDWNKGADSFQDMLLISKCQHNIIANSSFSWWAAYLNQNAGKLVCCPRKWNNIYRPDTVQHKSWVQL